jgi:solute carrier family 35 protein F1/2
MIQINRLYPIAYVLIIVGIIVYNIYPAPEPKFNKVLEQDKENKVWSSAEDDADDEISQQV